jgi:hypothetical protein
MLHNTKCLYVVKGLSNTLMEGPLLGGCCKRHTIYYSQFGKLKIRHS